ncbi:major facilitator superfamily domain-containing protein 6-like [Clytia hemisphaerica]|uniref:Major facilitator superfamily associated domain-containing protein n=1 Tax=Clytia hemisphaerica TaxID=252671 RepID=A0A7M5V350_9CNID|eukprot:TCONS_00030455-protein
MTSTSNKDKMNEKAQKLLSDIEIYELEDEERKSQQKQQHQLVPRRKQKKASVFFTLPTKCCYIFLAASNACIEPFLNVFLVSTGLTIGQSALISGIRILASLICRPCWYSLCTQKIRRKNTIFWCMCIIAAGLTFPMPWIADESKNVTLQECVPMKKFRPANNMIQTNPCSNGTSHNVLFFVMLSVNIASSVFTSALPLQLDVAANDVFTSTKYDINLHSQQMYDGIGQSIGALAAGSVAQQYKENYRGVFSVYLPMVGTLAVASVFLFYQVRSVPFVRQKHISCTQSAQGLGIMLKNMNIIIMMITIVVVGVADGINRYFLLLYMQNIEATKIQMGLSLAVSGLTSFLMMKFQRNNLEISRDNTSALTCLCTFCYALTLFFMSAITNPWLVLPVQLLYGIGHGIFWSAVQDYFQKQTKNKILTSLNQFIQILKENVGFIIANIIGGVLYSNDKSSFLFQVTSFFYFGFTIMLVLLSLVCYVYRKCTKQRKGRINNNKDKRIQDGPKLMVTDLE